MTGIAYGRVIGARSGQQQTYINATRRRPAQGAANFPGGQKVRGCQPYPLLPGVQRTHQRLQNVAVLAGIGIRDTTQTFAGCRGLGQMIKAEVFFRTPGETPGVGMELPVEQRLPVNHQWPGDFDHHFVPLADVFVRLPEFVGHTGAANHGQGLVHHQQFAMVAVEVAHAAPPVDRIVETQNHTGIGQLLAQAGVEGF